MTVPHKMEYNVSIKYLTLELVCWALKHKNEWGFKCLSCLCNYFIDIKIWETLSKSSKLTQLRQRSHKYNTKLKASVKTKKWLFAIFVGFVSRVFVSQSEIQRDKKKRARDCVMLYSLKLLNENVSIKSRWICFQTTTFWNGFVRIHTNLYV